MKITFICIAALVCAGCANSTTAINGGKLSPQFMPDTIINNLIFDTVKAGWFDWCNHLDSCAQEFVADVPPGSASQRSLLLWPIWPPNTTWIHSDLRGLSSGIYQLTVWAKAGLTTFEPSIQSSFGSFGIKLSNNAPLGFQDFGNEGSRVTDSAWHLYSILDTVTLLPSDTLRVFLTGGCSDTANSWGILFNNISLMKLK